MDQRSQPRAERRRLSLVDRAGRPRMVDISDKPVTARRAVAEAAVAVSPETMSLVIDGGAAKGDVLTVAELAQAVMRVVGLEGALEFDPSKPDAMARKLLDSTRMRALGWRPATRLADGIARTYQWCREHDVFEPERATA